ncbi:fimbrial protein [Rosenbergiella epipactidis]|uniref:fimbrial protein n=1 Tax=Rosenbergiella epipactidis TaxID=1544694 RepID=UPI001F4E3E23|nr:fimbrial protein [Rosenbergiella epipactidis]
MRLISKLFITCNFILLQPCLADCPFIKDGFESLSIPGFPIFLTLPAKTFNIDADAAAGTLIGKMSVAANTHNDVYYDCNKIPTYLYGKTLNTTGLTDLSNNTFAVGDTGLSILPSLTSKGATGYFPSMPRTLQVDPDSPYIVFTKNTSFEVQIYKRNAQLKLHDPQGEVVLPPTVAFITQWINSDTPGNNRAFTVNLGGVTIVSTPVCKTDQSIKDVPFGSITETTLNNGIKRDLHFTLQCQTDFGTYNAIASINARQRTSDNKYITVTDAAGNTDRLKIGITDSQGKTMNVDGTSSESKYSVQNNNAAQFNWSATLLRASPTLLPAVGDFTAHAEITFQIN